MIDTDLAWAAGFIDGEGYVAIVHSKAAKGYSKGHYSLRLTVEQVDFRPLLKLNELFGGVVKPQSVVKNPKARPIFVWTLNSKQAEVALILLLPHLVHKYEQAEMALQYRAMVGKSGHNMKPETLDKIEFLRKEMIRIRQKSWSKEWIND